MRRRRAAVAAFRRDRRLDDESRSIPDTGRIVFRGTGGTTLRNARMFRLIKLIVALVGLAAFVWFGANVPLGSRTLFEHLQAIGRTHETQELLDGTARRPNL